MASRSTRSSRPRRSTGSPITTRSSGTSPPSSGPGGRLVAQCGGSGNIAAVRAILATIGDGWLGEAHYETPEATERRLAAAGFRAIETWLQPEPTRFEPGEPLETFLRTVILGGHVARLPEDERDAFVHLVASRLPEPVIDYVRLNILATRA